MKPLIAALPDYHIHTPFCKHATGEIELYVERALEIGLEEIGFSDHMPVMPEPQFCMGYEDVDRYIDRVHELQSRYAGQIIIRLGCEMDMVLEKQGEIRALIDNAQFDYVIGSLHYLDNWPFDQEKYKNVFEGRNLDALYEHFFDTIIRAARTGLYDIAGHIDNIKRMGYRPEGNLDILYERVAAVLKSMDCAVELNTSGIDSAAREPYPSPGFLRIFRKHDVPVTLGSDAHSPDRVGKHYDAALRYLQDAGYSRVACFSGRKRFFKSLVRTSDEKGVTHE
jgi:histidinol-phosphatase (PHP family)